MKPTYFTIEAGVPMPRVCHCGGHATPFTTALSQLEVGESFLSDRDSGKTNGSIATWVRYHKSERRFTVRSCDGGSRVWRVA